MESEGINVDSDALTRCWHFWEETALLDHFYVVLGLMTTYLFRNLDIFGLQEAVGANLVTATPLPKPKGCSVFSICEKSIHGMNVYMAWVQLDWYHCHTLIAGNCLIKI